MIARAVRRGGSLALIGLLLGWAILLRPAALGGDALFLVVRGDSMLPTHETGDLVILRSAATYRVGEVVAYRVPAGELGAGRIVIHRIVGGDGGTGFLVKGDHNPSIDPWRPKQADVAGAEWLALAGVGRWLAWLHQPFVLAGLAAALVAGWFAWRASRDAEGRRERRMVETSIP